MSTGATFQELTAKTFVHVICGAKTKQQQQQKGEKVKQEKIAEQRKKI